MNSRTDLAAQFLHASGWGDAECLLLNGDASDRRYSRLVNKTTDAQAILMDAPPESCGSQMPFCTIAKHLRKLGLSAPSIMAQDLSAGFLILEDLGDDLFARAIPNDPDLEEKLYAAAVVALVQVQNGPAPQLPIADPTVLAGATDLAFSHYCTAFDSAPDVAVQSAFMSGFSDLLSEAFNSPPVLVLRDYHAENLLWLPGRNGNARVGLLDFQDAVLGHPAYDLVSLLQDARRDVSHDIEAKMIDLFLSLTDQSEQDFKRAYTLIGIQRHLRILGVFTRLCTQFGKSSYIDLIPRTWAHLQRNLQHPCAAPIADILNRVLPHPTPDQLSNVKSSCR